MANVNAIRDDNHVPVALGVKSTNTAETTPFTINPVTGRLLTDSAGGGSGDVVGPASSTDNAVARFDSTTGKLLQDSVVLIGDTGAVTGVTTLVASSTITSNGLLVKETGGGSDLITIVAPASIAAGYTLTLPVDDGNSGEVLSTNGSGVLSWVSAGGVPTTITVANEATDTTCFIGFFTAATGDLGPKTNANLTFNSSTGVLTAAQTIVGSISGNAATASAVAVGGITGLGTGVATALAINVGSAGAFVTFNGALGTPSSGTVTNLTGTASININGTVGATTPTTGVFTTLVAGSTTSLLLGTAGSAVGNIGFRNATSGTITLAPVTGALGTVTLTLPAATDTVAVLAASQAFTNKTYNGLTVSTTTGTFTLTNGKTLAVTNTLTLSGTDSTVMTFPTTSATIARTDAANTFTGASTASAWVLTSPTITTSIVPTSNDGAALGSTSNMFSDLFLASGAVINFNNGDVTLTHSSNLLTYAGGQFTFGANTVYATETDNGNSSTADTIDWTLSNKQKSTLTGNCTFTFTAPGGPCSLVLKLVQDATGSRTVTWPATVHWPAGSAPTLTTTANKVDIITFYWDGTTYFANSTLNFTA